MIRLSRLKGIVAIVTMLVCFSIQAVAQNLITGKVSDSKDGSPLAGVSVTVKGTKTTVQTKADGTFSISAPAGSTLVITSVGFTSQQVAADAGSLLNISLAQSNQQLNEVVVIGYGTQKKKDLTGAITAISSKDFIKGAITTPEQLIAGKVAGVQITSNGGAPGAGSTIRIRGGASLNASNDPLIVIDGVPVDNGAISGAANPLNLINPNDIESFNILKDASAAAIYGSRASNGVIIITTKKGRKGKPVFNFNTQASFYTPYKLADVLSANEYRGYIKTYGDQNAVALMGDASTNWQDEIFQNAFAQDNNLSVAGSAGNMPYRASIGFLNQDGILRTGNLKRVSASINISPRFLDDHLKVDLNLKGSNSKNRFANQDAIGAAVNFDPTQPVRSSSTRFGGYFEWLDPNSTTGLKALAPKNPVGLLEQKIDKSTVNRSIGNAQIDYKFHFLPELRANLNLGYDISKGEGNVFINDSAASNYNRFKDANNVFHGGVNNNFLQEKQNTLLEFYLNYVKDISAINSRVDVMAGYSYQDFLTTITNFSDKTADATIVTSPNFAFDKPQNRLISFYGRLNFNYNSRYLLTATLRRDGSSRFSKDNRWGLFPSVALAWKISDESFLQSSKISDLKLRLGYGVTGQQDGINNYDYISYYKLSSQTAQYQFGDSYYFMYRPGGYYENRKWEQTATYNAAIDYGFLKNRIFGSIDFYFRKTTFLLNEVNQPAGTNFSNKIVANVGDMENKGVEFTINAQAVRKKDLMWDIGFNATYNKNTITNLTLAADPSSPGNQFGGISGGTGQTILINSAGYNRGSFFVYQQVYDKSGKSVDGVFVDRNKDGIINDKDLYKYKSADPRVFIGINTNVTYKKWNAGFVMRGSFNNYVYNNIASSTGVNRNIINPLGYLNNGYSGVLETNFSGNGEKYFLSDYFVENASFLRMDNINVGYNLGKILNDKASFRVNANIQNAFLITKYAGVDPEISGGIDNNLYPRPRVYVLSLNLDF